MNSGNKNTWVRRFWENQATVKSINLLKGVINMEKAKELIQELDTQTSNVLLRLETLRTIGQELSYLREDVEATRQKNDLTSQGIHYVEVDRKIRLLDDLLNYCLGGLERDYETVEVIRNTLHDLVVEGEE